MATCETNGHIFGHKQVCIFCETPMPKKVAAPIDNPMGLPANCVSALVSADRSRAWGIWTRAGSATVALLHCRAAERMAYPTA